MAGAIVQGHNINSRGFAQRAPFVPTAPFAGRGSSQTYTSSNTTVTRGPQGGVNVRTVTHTTNVSTHTVPAVPAQIAGVVAVVQGSSLAPQHGMGHGSLRTATLPGNPVQAPSRLAARTLVVQQQQGRPAVQPRLQTASNRTMAAHQVTVHAQVGAAPSVHRVRQF
jgi:hypothetical protein